MSDSTPIAPLPHYPDKDKRLVQASNQQDGINIKSSLKKKEIMTDNPCDSCREDCIGGIIYGNCELFRTWCRDHKYIGSGYTSRLFAQQGVQGQSVEVDRTNGWAVGIK